MEKVSNIRKNKKRWELQCTMAGDLNLRVHLESGVFPEIQMKLNMGIISQKIHKVRSIEMVAELLFVSVGSLGVILWFISKEVDK